MAEKNAKENSLKQAAKKGLKTMKKTRQRHPLREEGRIIKYGSQGWARNFWLSAAATAVMTVTLIISFITVVASAILSNTADAMRDKIDITIYLKPQTSEEILGELTAIIAKDPNIKSVVTSTSENEYNKLVEEYAEDEELLNVLDEEMRALIIAEMQSTMRVKVYNPDNLDSIRAIVETDPLFVEYVDVNLDPTYDVNQVEIATITMWAEIARTGGLVLAVVFLVISVLIIFSTIRMAIFSRREEIYMMRLVGADKNFIRGPFLVEAEICGVIAGVLAATAAYFGFMGAAPVLADYGIDVTAMVEILSSNKLILVYLIFIAAGVIIGRIAAWLAISKYLHKAA